VYFFRVAEGGEFMPRMESAAAHIGQLPFDDQGRYQSTSNDGTVLVLFVDQASYPIRLQFARIRRDNLPVVEKAGDVTPLELDDEAGLMDSSHLVIFPDGVVAAEFNQDAPRIRRLGSYLFFKARANLRSAPRFLPLFQRDVLAELEAFPAITILELEAHSADTELVAEADEHIGAAFRACRSAGATRRASLTLNAGRSPGLSLKNLARKLFSHPSSREGLRKLRVVGGSGEARKPLDMLEEYLITTQSFVRRDQRSKAIVAEDAYRVLERAYEENRHKFPDAATANDPW
jgi:hypothetical protein